jgi:hypothetical protein
MYWDKGAGASFTSSGSRSTAFSKSTRVSTGFPGIVSWHKICVIFTRRAEENGTMSRQKRISRCKIPADLIEIKEG